MPSFCVNLRRISPALALVLMLASAACSSDSTGGSGGTSGATGTSGGTSGATSGGTSGTSGTPNPGGPLVDGIPTSAAAMNAFLQKKEYSTWAKESAPHKSTGPHGGMVLTYLNPKLDASLKAAAAEHPVGSASVKEFYTGGNLSGWAAYVKTQAASDGGKGWYWYEVFDTAPGATSIEGQGAGTCTGCHSAGKDYVQIPYPLQ